MDKSFNIDNDSELGVHVDGYIATAAHTTIVADNAQEAVTGRAADVVAATYFAYEAAIRMLRPGVKVKKKKRDFRMGNGKVCSSYLQFYYIRLLKSLVLSPKLLLISVVNLLKVHSLLP